MFLVIKSIFDLLCAIIFLIELREVCQQLFINVFASSIRHADCNIRFDMKRLSGAGLS